jgi:hypothetical protein
MANVFRVNVYQINQRVMTRDQPIAMAFPSAGVLLQDCSTSPTRSLPSGYNVYGVIRLSNGVNTSVYYTAETLSQLITLAG